jgi:mono/diheme cytochrome c family protein
MILVPISREVVRCLGKILLAVPPFVPAWLRAVFIMAGLAACGEALEPPAFLQVADGEPARGRELIRSYGCGTCHTIAGIRGARGTVGPQLTDYAERNLLAGILPNTPHHLVPWLMDPAALDPRTGMPTMGITEAEARDIAAYLYTLESPP